MVDLEIAKRREKERNFLYEIPYVGHELVAFFNIIQKSNLINDGRFNEQAYVDLYKIGKQINIMTKRNIILSKIIDIIINYKENCTQSFFMYDSGKIKTMNFLTYVPKTRKFIFYTEDRQIFSTKIDKFGISIFLSLEEVKELYE